MRETLGILTIWLLVFGAGCEAQKPYGVEAQLLWPGSTRQVWAVAPAIDLSGQEQVDPILQADLLYQQLQQVHGLTIIPVNRVAQVMAALRLEQVRSSEQARRICEALGADALVAATVTAYDPYNPPKMGASLAVFAARTTPAEGDFVQVVGLYDASNGSVRERLLAYAQGRSDPRGPMGAKEYLVNMDRFAGFVYHQLLEDVLDSPRLRAAAER